MATRCAFPVAGGSCGAHFALYDETVGWYWCIYHDGPLAMLKGAPWRR